MRGTGGSREVIAGEGVLVNADLNPAPKVITSLRNPRIQRARRLLRRVHRREEGAFLVEGTRAITDVLEAGPYIDEVFVTEHAAVPRALQATGGEGPLSHVVTPSVLAAITDSVTPQGIVAIARSPLRKLVDVGSGSGLVVVLAGVGDPGNVGTLIRTAAAAAADAVIVTTGSCDPLNPKTARAATSSLFAIPVVADTPLEDALVHLAGRGYITVGADATARRTIHDADLARPVAIVVGNEAHGLRDEDIDRLDELVSIPMPGSVDSLNVATAGAIVIFEALRQRRLSFALKEEGRD